MCVEYLHLFFGQGVQISVFFESEVVRFIAEYWKTTQTLRKSKFSENLFGTNFRQIFVGFVSTCWNLKFKYDIQFWGQEIWVLRILPC